MGYSCEVSRSRKLPRSFVGNPAVPEAWAGPVLRRSVGTARNNRQPRYIAGAPGRSVRQASDGPEYQRSCRASSKAFKAEEVALAAPWARRDLQALRTALSTAQISLRLP